MGNARDLSQRGKTMAITKVNKAKITVNDIEMDCDGDFSFSMPETPCYEWRGMRGPSSATFSVPFEISKQDSKKILDFFKYLLFPKLAYYEWIYRKSILNPYHTKYREHLRRVNQ